MINLLALIQHVDVLIHISIVIDSLCDCLQNDTMVIYCAIRLRWGARRKKWVENTMWPFMAISTFGTFIKSWFIHQINYKLNDNSVFVSTFVTTASEFHKISSNSLQRTDPSMRWTAIDVWLGCISTSVVMLVRGIETYNITDVAASDAKWCPGNNDNHFQLIYDRCFAILLSFKVFYDTACGKTDITF